VILSGTLFRGSGVDGLRDCFLQELSILIALGPGREDHLGSVFVVGDTREGEEVDLEMCWFRGGKSVPDGGICAGILFFG